MLGTFGGALEARHIDASNGKLVAEVTGDVETEEGVLVIRRIHVAMGLVASEESRDTVDRVHGIYAMRCPLYRTLYKAVVEGYGYDLHQDCNVEITDTYAWKPQDEIKRFEWEAGDVIYVPPCTIHQHFNGDPERPARLISCTNRIYKNSGLNDLVQVEDAPEYDPNVTLTAELMRTYLEGGKKKVA